MNGGPANRYIYVVTPLAPDGGPSLTVNPFNAIIVPYSPVDIPPQPQPPQPPLGIWQDPGGWNPNNPNQPWPPEEVPPEVSGPTDAWLKEPEPGGIGYYNSSTEGMYAVIRPVAQPKGKKGR